MSKSILHKEKKKLDHLKKYYSQEVEKLDLIFYIAIIFHSLSLMFQFTLIQSDDAYLKQVGLMAIAQAVLSFMGISFTALLVTTGFLNVRNEIIEKRKIESSRIITGSSYNLVGEDLPWLVAGIFAQIGLYIIFGSVPGSQIEVLQSYGFYPLLLAFNAGISEELFFSLFLSSVILSLGKSKTHLFVSALFISGSFMLLHLVVYGSDRNALFFVLLLRVIYFLIYYKTRRISIPIFLHCLNNILFINMMLFS
ncbi:MAG: CPBP family intramembrane metalloprotease [Candidatus Lokiarchaeota archaeon]|nr:CPBP family intramembrane metalloprotease [Candidatus Lokiarchaeota archaeon]